MLTQRVQETKQILVNEDDPLWARLRHQHIQDTIEALTAEFKDFLAKNAATAKMKEDAPQSLAEMSKAIRAFPQVPH